MTKRRFYYGNVVGDKENELLSKISISFSCFKALTFVVNNEKVLSKLLYKFLYEKSKALKKENCFH